MTRIIPIAVVFTLVGCTSPAPRYRLEPVATCGVDEVSAHCMPALTNSPRTFYIGEFRPNPWNKDDSATVQTMPLAPEDRGAVACACVGHDLSGPLDASPFCMIAGDKMVIHRDGETLGRFYRCAAILPRPR